MSRSNPTNDAVNPAQRFFQWEGSTGKIKWYNKETKENEYVDLPFTFLVLDRLVTITGFNESRKSGYWSNEIRNTQTDVLVVKDQGGEVYRGLYQGLGVKGASYAASVYIAWKESKDSAPVIANFRMSGAALGAWIDFTKKVNVMNGGVAIIGSEDRKKGIIDFKVPVFEEITVRDESNDAALSLDKELQVYLENYLARRLPSETRVQADDIKPHEDVQIQELPEDKPGPEFDASKIDF